jgi:Ca2+-dependent lipid-binding protein
LSRFCSATLTRSALSDPPNSYNTDNKQSHSKGYIFTRKHWYRVFQYQIVTSHLIGFKTIVWLVLFFSIVFCCIVLYRLSHPI